MAAFACTAQPSSRDLSLAPAEVDAFLLCPIQVPGLDSRRITVRRDERQFASLVVALSAADERAPREIACPAYADAPQRVLAKTASHTIVVHIPVDECGHYQGTAATALLDVRAGH